MNFQENFQKLPTDIKTAIYSVETSQVIEQIADKHHLLIDKMGVLAEETGLVMLGATHPKDFIRNLSDKLGVDRETARKVADDVNQQIFSKVRESLRALHGVADEKEANKNDQNGERGQSSRIPHGAGRDLAKMEEQGAIKPKPLEIKPAPPLSWPASPIGPGADKPAELKILAPRMDGVPLDLPVAPMIQRDQSGQNDQSSATDLVKMKEQETPRPPIPQKPTELPSSIPPTGPAFKEKLEEGVFVQSPELRKTERPTIDPYREPIE